MWPIFVLLWLFFSPRSPLQISFLLELMLQGTAYNRVRLAFVPAIVPLRIRRKRQRLPPNPPIASARGVKQSDHPRPLGAGALVDRILRFFNG